MHEIGFRKGIHGRRSHRKPPLSMLKAAFFMAKCRLLRAKRPLKAMAETVFAIHEYGIYRR